MGVDSWTPWVTRESTKRDEGEPKLEGAKGYKANESDIKDFLCVRAISKRNERAWALWEGML